MKKALVCLLLAATFLSGCLADKEAVSNENSSIVYEIFPSSFYDSDGNGVGDFTGQRRPLPPDGCYHMKTPPMGFSRDNIPQAQRLVKSRREAGKLPLPAASYTNT